MGPSPAHFGWQRGGSSPLSPMLAMPCILVCIMHILNWHKYHNVYMHAVKAITMHKLCIVMALAWSKWLGRGGSNLLVLMTPGAYCFLYALGERHTSYSSFFYRFNTIYCIGKRLTILFVVYSWQYISYEKQMWCTRSPTTPPPQSYNQSQTNLHEEQHLHSCWRMN